MLPKQPSSTTFRQANSYLTCSYSSTPTTHSSLGSWGLLREDLIQNRAVITMTSVEMGEAGLLAVEIANFKGTFVEAVDAGILPAPGWMPFDEWIRYRQKEGLRPPRQGLDRLMVYLEELKIWSRVMKHYHGPSDDQWKTIEEKHAEAFMTVESYLNSLEEVFDNEEKSEGRVNCTLGASTAEGSSGLTLSAVPKGVAAGAMSSVIVPDPATAGSTHPYIGSPPYSEQFSSESNEYS